MEDGELVLMDYCPDLHYYRCDVTRQWPVNGKFSPVQRELYTFYLGRLRGHSLLDQAARHRAGDPAGRREEDGRDDGDDEVLEAVVRERGEAVRRRLSRRAPGHRRGGNLGHAVGMSTHDMGGGSGVMRPGLVFTIEPQFRIPEERIFIRLEDMIVITDTEARDHLRFRAAIDRRRSRS